MESTSGARTTSLKIVKSTIFLATASISIVRPQGANDRHIVRNNRVHDNGARGILLGSGDDHVAYNNLVWSNADGIVIGFGTPRNNKIYNNTIYVIVMTV